jgi:hypothetical protein
VTAKLTDRATEVEKELEAQIAQDKLIIKEFQANYINMLKEIELTVFQREKALAEEVYFDDDNLPFFRGQLLKKFASASDQSRIIFPYLLSCLKTSLEKGGNHLGFSLFDEPLQQNPDEKGRERLIAFFEKLGSLTTGQILTFTSLSV